MSIQKGTGIDLLIGSIDQRKGILLPVKSDSLSSFGEKRQTDLRETETEKRET